MEMKKIIISVFCLLFLNCNVFASDAYVFSEEDFGQGFFRERGSECFFITAGHVVKDSTEIELVTSSRHRYKAEVITIYPDDVAILRVNLPVNASCPKSSWGSGNKLKILLNIEQEGIVKLRLDDGSRKQVPVYIKTFDAYRYIQITPKNQNDKFTKGFSGSPLFIAGTLAGMLQSVSKGVGNVFRQDALNNTVSLFFNDVKEYNKPKQSINVTTSKPVLEISQNEVVKKITSKPVVFQGKIAKGQVVEQNFEGVSNSPVLFTASGAKHLLFYVQIFKGKKKLYEKLVNADRDIAHNFTPQKNGTYTVKLLGYKHYGEYSLNLDKI